MVDAYGMTDTGSVRSENQDRILLAPELGLYAVCDGMGGHRHGGLAAELAVSAIRHFIEASQDSLDVTWPFGYNFALSVDANRLATSVRLANRTVYRRSEEAVEHAGMGTTVAVVLTQAEQVVVANVGDSRVYRWRNGEFTQLTVDDTMVASLAEQGLIKQEDLADHPMRNVLTQAAGSQVDVNVHLWEDVPQPGDRFLLCSDGVYGVISKDDLAAALAATDGDLTAPTEQLIQAAMTAGSTDNVSVLLLCYR